MSLAPGPRRGRTAATRATPQRREALGVAWRDGRIRLLLLVALVLVAYADVARLGFFFDDFLLRDAVRRMPLGGVLLGQYGIRPWYRPLSRELYFLLTVLAGPLGLAVARTISLLTLASLLRGIQALGDRWFGPPAGTVAAVLLLGLDVTKFLVGWASGYQDLLAATLVVWAVVDTVRGRAGRAALWVGLAPLAKETGFIALPLVVGCGVFVRRLAPRGRWLGLASGAALAAALLHVLARTTWTRVPPPAGVTATATSVAAAIGAPLIDLVHAWLPQDAWGWAAGILAAAIVWLLLPRPIGEPAVSPWPSWGRERGFVLAAAALSLAPALGPLVRPAYRAQAHFAFPAWPWIVLGVASVCVRAPWIFLRAALTLVALVSVGLLAYHAPDLNAPEGWVVGPLGWPEAMRIDARTRRLSEDLRTLFATRPDSLVVLFEATPNGSVVQTGDGPALREILADPTVRSYWIREAPPLLDPRRVAIVRYDPIEHHGFVELPPDCGGATRRAVLAILADNPDKARGWMRYGSGCADSPFARELLAVAALTERGAAAYAAERAALADSLHPIGASVPDGDACIDAAFDGAWRRPLTASAHAHAASELETCGADLLAALELRIAVALGDSSTADALQLGTIEARQGLAAAARRTLTRARNAPGAPGNVRARAAEGLATLGDSAATP